MGDIKKIKPREYAIEKLLWYIHKNNLGPHTKLPSERELCSMWNINRTTLRTAIERLVEENILYTEVGSGTYMAPAKLKINLQDAKSTTESIKRTGNYLITDVLESKVIKADSEIAGRLKIPEGEKVFYLKRLRKKNNSPFRIEQSYINYSFCNGLENYNFADESLFKILKKHGITMAHGYEDVGIDFVNANEANILQINEGQYVFSLKGITKDTKGRIVEYFKILTRSDQVQFTSILNRDDALEE